MMIPDECYLAMPTSMNNASMRAGIWLNQRLNIPSIITYDDTLSVSFETQKMQQQKLSAKVKATKPRRF